jgi:hypothetical protein
MPPMTSPAKRCAGTPAKSRGDGQRVLPADAADGPGSARSRDGPTRSCRSRGRAAPPDGLRVEHGRHRLIVPYPTGRGLPLACHGAPRREMTRQRREYRLVGGAARSRRPHGECPVSRLPPGRQSTTKPKEVVMPKTPRDRVAALIKDVELARPCAACRTSRRRSPRWDCGRSSRSGAGKLRKQAAVAAKQLEKHVQQAREGHPGGRGEAEYEAASVKRGRR